MPTPKQLNPRQKNFCRLMAEGKHTQAECYRLAGYSRGKAGQDNSWHLAKQPHIKAYIAKLQALASARTTASLAYVLDGLKEVADAGRERVLHAEIAGELVYKMADASAANRALELLGKTMGAFVDRTQVELTDSTKAHIEHLLKIVIAEVNDPATVSRIIERIQGELGGGDAILP